MVCLHWESVTVQSKSKAERHSVSSAAQCRIFLKNENQAHFAAPASGSESPTAEHTVCENVDCSMSALLTFPFCVVHRSDKSQ
jgi:hypothetical protein